MFPNLSITTTQFLNQNIITQSKAKTAAAYPRVAVVVTITEEYRQDAKEK